MLTPVENPTAYGLVETDADGNIRRFLEKPSADKITCDTINAGIYVLEPETFDRIPKDTAWSIERSFFPSLIERGETFVAYVIAVTGSTSARRRNTCRFTATSWTAVSPRRPFAGRPGTGVRVAPGARVEEGVELQGPCFVDEGAVVKAGRAIGPYSVHRPPDATSTKRAVDRRLDHLAERLDRPGGRRARLDPRPQLPHRPQRDARAAVVLGDKTVVTDYSRQVL